MKKVLCGLGGCVAWERLDFPWKEDPRPEKNPDLAENPVPPSCATESPFRRLMQNSRGTGEFLGVHPNKNSGFIDVNVEGTFERVFFGPEHCGDFEFKDLEPGDALVVDFRLGRPTDVAKYRATKVTRCAKKPQNIQPWQETGEVLGFFTRKKAGLIVVNVEGTDDHVFFGGEHCRGFELKDLQPGDAVQVDFLLNRHHLDLAKYRATKVTRSAKKPQNIQVWQETGRVVTFSRPKKASLIAVNVGGTDDHVFFGWEHCRGFKREDLQPGDAVQVDFRLNRFRKILFPQNIVSAKYRFRKISPSDVAKYRAITVTRSMRTNPRNIQRRREMAEVGTLPELTTTADRPRRFLPASVYRALTAESLRRRHMPEQPVQAYMPVPVLYALPYDADEQSGPRADMLIQPSSLNPLAREYVPGKKKRRHYAES